MPLSPSQRLASIEDLLLYRLGRLASVGGAMVVRLCEGGYGITRREWAVIGQLYEGGSLPPSVLAERMHRDRARTSRTLLLWWPNAWSCAPSRPMTAAAPWSG